MASADSREQLGAITRSLREGHQRNTQSPFSHRPPPHFNRKQHQNVFQRMGALEELYEYAVLMARRLIGKGKLQQRYILKFSFPNSRSWVKLNATRNKSIVENALKALHYLKAVRTSAEQPTDEQKDAIETYLSQLTEIQGLRRNETYDDAKAAWENGARGVSISVLACALENGILELLRANGCITFVRASDLRVSVKSNENLSRQQAALLDAFDAAETVHLALELDLPASPFAVNKALDAVGDRRAFSKFCQGRIERWRKYEWHRYNRNDQGGETFSLMEGLFDQILKHASSIDLPCLIKEATNMKLIETRVTLKADLQSRKCLNDILPVISVLQEGCKRQKIDVEEIWFEHLSICQNEEQATNSQAYTSLARATETGAEAHRDHTKVLIKDENRTTRTDKMLFEDRKELFRTIQVMGASGSEINKETCATILLRNDDSWLQETNQEDVEDDGLQSTLVQEEDRVPTQTTMAVQEEEKTTNLEEEMSNIDKSRFIVEDMKGIEGGKNGRELVEAVESANYCVIESDANHPDGQSPNSDYYLY